MIQTFIKNEHNEQGIFLGFYVFSCAVIWWSLFGLYPLLFTLLTFFCSFGLYAVFSLLVTRLQNSDLLFFIRLCLLLFLVTLSVVYQVYTLAIGIFMVLTFSWYKKNYLPIVSKNITFEKFSNFDRFLMDFEIINYHFETEFRTLNLLKKTNIVASLIFFWLALLIFAQLNGTSSIEFEIDRTFMVALFYGLLVNSLLMTIIRLIIIQACNPPVAFTVFQKVLGSAGVVGLGTLNFLGFHAFNL